MEIQLKKKIPLMVNIPLREKLEADVNSIIEEILDLKEISKPFFENQSNENLFEFIRKYQTERDIDNTEKQNELLFIKFKDELAKFKEDYPNSIKEKALEIFCSDSDREVCIAVISMSVNINRSLEQLNLSDLTLETLVLNEEIVYNKKIDTQLKKRYVRYCENKKQIELLRLAEELSEIVQRSIKVELISNNSLGINISNIIDIDTGKIRYNYIASR